MSCILNLVSCILNFVPCILTTGEFECDVDEDVRQQLAEVLEKVCGESGEKRFEGTADLSSLGDMMEANITARLEEHVQANIKLYLREVSILLFL